MFVNFELKLLQSVNVNIFCINSFHTHPSPSRWVGTESMIGSILYWRKHAEKVL